MILRLFHHTELEHKTRATFTNKPKKGIPFIVGERGIADWVCDIGVCCNFRGIQNRYW